MTKPEKDEFRWGILLLPPVFRGDRKRYTLFNATRTSSVGLIMGLTLLIYTYLIGGLTFLPGLVIVFVYLHPIFQEEQEEEQEQEFIGKKLKAGEIEELNQLGLDTYKVGWITVTQEYLESIDEITSSTQSISDSTSNKSAYSSLYKLVKDSEDPVNNSSNSSIKEQPNTTTNTTNTNKSSNQKKHRYYAILKHGNLFLYKNEKLKDVKHVIVLSNHMISIWPKGLTDAQLFTKYTSISIMKKNWSRNRRLSDNYESNLSHDEFNDSPKKLNILDVLDPNNNLKPPPGSFFIYCDNNSDKEDWYFALIRATKIDDDSNKLIDPRIHAKTLHFETSNMMDLIQTLYSSEGQLNTKWLNALIGRIFLSLQKTELLSNFLKKRIDKKLNKIKTPGFLDKFQIVDLTTGNSAPFITFPELKEINPNGEVLVSSYIHYFGSMSLKIKTKLNINLGFKPREVDVLLKITLVKLQGPLIIKFKPPPSNRLWYTFEKEPLINLKIEPIISSRQLTYNIITNTIEKKFKEAIKESLVLPFWDDFAYYDTENEFFRGGIWDKTERENQNANNNTTEENLEVYDSNSIDNASMKSSLKTDDSSINLDKASSTTELSSSKPSNSRLKISNTFNDISKKLKKPRSQTQLNANLDEESEISAEPMSSSPSIKSSSTIPSKSKDLGGDPASSKKSISTLKKIGKWYFKDDKALNTTSDQEITYTPPEMISNRRSSPRKSSFSSNKSTQDVPSKSNSMSPTYDFGSRFPLNGFISGNFDGGSNSSETTNENDNEPDLKSRPTSIELKSTFHQNDTQIPISKNDDNSTFDSDLSKTQKADLISNLKILPPDEDSDVTQDSTPATEEPPSVNISPANSSNETHGPIPKNLYRKPPPNDTPPLAPTNERDLIEDI